MVGNTRKRIRLAAITVAGTALLALVACGSDDAPAAAPAPAATPVPTAAPAPTPTVEVESLSATDRVIAGLPESTPENSVVAEGSSQEAVIARFNAMAALNDTLEGRALILAQQEFCSPEQRLTSDEITPGLVEERATALASLMSRGGQTPEGFSMGNVSVMINIPTEALVLFTTFEFGEKKHDLAEEWVDQDGEWYLKVCYQAI